MALTVICTLHTRARRKKPRLCTSNECGKIKHFVGVLKDKRYHIQPPSLWHNRKTLTMSYVREDADDVARVEAASALDATTTTQIGDCLDTSTVGDLKSQKLTCIRLFLRTVEPLTPDDSGSGPNTFQTMLYVLERC